MRFFMVGRVGFEPTANRLKAYCSTTELPTQNTRQTIMDSFLYYYCLILHFYAFFLLQSIETHDK